MVSTTLSRPIPMAPGEIINEYAYITEVSASNSTITANPGVIIGVIWSIGASVSRLDLKDGSGGSVVLSLSNGAVSGGFMGLNIPCPLGIFYDTTAGTNPFFTVLYRSAFDAE